MLVPGTIWAEYHKEVGKIMTSELLGLGLLEKADVQNEDPDWPAYKKYFMHGTSHWLGLDVHDAGALRVDGKHRSLEPGMCFTIEPMLNAGVWRTVKDKVDGWTVRTADGTRAAHEEHMVAITADGPEILSHR